MVLKLNYTRILVFTLVIFSVFFTFNNDVTAKENKELPKLYFEGEVDKLKTKKEEIKIDVKYESENINFTSYASIKLQGTSSLAYEKKNYTIKFYEDENLENKLKVDFGWGMQNKYCLKANWIDKTHSRNVVSAKLVGQMQRKYNLFNDSPNNGAIDGFPIEIYLNGEFLGLYTMNIPKDAWMFNMDENNKNHLVFSGEGYFDANLFKNEATFETWEIEVGEESDESLDKLNRLINFVKNSSDEEFKNNFNKYFDLDSVLNYYAMVEFAELGDNIAKNMLLVTYDGNIWYTSLYDLDTSWGTEFHGKSTLDYTKTLLPTGSRFWNKMRRNFPNELADRYFELRKSIFSKENIMKEFYNFKNSIPQSSWRRENKRWDAIPGYDINQINNFIDIRINYTDKLFTDMYTNNYSVAGVCIKNNDGSVTTKLINLREDVMLKNGDSYTFKENGKHTFSYTDFTGNDRYLEVEVVGVRNNIIKNNY